MEGCLLWLPNRRIRLLRVGCYREVWSLHADKPGLLWSVEFLNTLTVFLILSLFCVIWFNWSCILWSWALTDPLSPDCHFHPEWTIKPNCNKNRLKVHGSHKQTRKSVFRRCCAWYLVRSPSGMHAAAKSWKVKAWQNWHNSSSSFNAKLTILLISAFHCPMAE